MLWLWILGVLAALFLLFCLMRLGVQIVFEQPVRAWVTLGPLHVQVAPSKGKPPKKEKKSGSESKKKSPDLLKRLKTMRKPTAKELRSAYDALWPPMKKALRRVGRGIRIDPLTLSVTLAGRDDPAGAAERYGLVNGAVWAVMPALEQLVTIPNPHIHIGLDFDAGKAEARGEVGISLRIGTLLAVALGTGIPALKWFLKYRKANKDREKDEQNEQPDAPAA